MFLVPVIEANGLGTSKAFGIVVRELRVAVADALEGCDVADLAGIISDVGERLTGSLVLLMAQSTRDPVLVVVGNPSKPGDS